MNPSLRLEGRGSPDAAAACMLALCYACQASPLLMVKPAIRGADSMSKDGMKLRPAHTEERPSSSQLPTPYRPAAARWAPCSVRAKFNLSIRSLCASASPEIQLVALGRYVRPRPSIQISQNN